MQKKAIQAMQALIEGNARFQSGNSVASSSPTLRSELTAGQSPFAAVIRCADSRVAPEIVFDQPLGSLFVCGVAGNIPTIEIIESMEYAVGVLGVSLIVVMGHSNCGGVNGCIQMCSGKAPALEERTSFVGRWMDILRPGYEKVKDIKDDDERQSALEKQAVVVSLENLMKRISILLKS